MAPRWPWQASYLSGLLSASSCEDVDLARGWTTLSIRQPLSPPVPTRSEARWWPLSRPFPGSFPYLGPSLISEDLIPHPFTTRGSSNLGKTQPRTTPLYHIKQVMHPCLFSGWRYVQRFKQPPGAIKPSSSCLVPIPFPPSFQPPLDGPY